jgi:hypothetical protein
MKTIKEELREKRTSQRTQIVAQQNFAKTVFLVATK